MSDKEARVLGAGSLFRVGDQDYRLSPIGIGTLSEMQREALRAYKQRYLQTYVDLQEHLPPGKLDSIIEEVARWDVDKLPAKRAFECSEVPINELVKNRLATFYGETVQQLKDRPLQFVLATALDEEKITLAEVKELTGVEPRSAMIPYDMWWATASHEGRILMLWCSLQKHHSNVTRKHVSEWDLAKIIEGSRTVEALTAPQAGNT